MISVAQHKDWKQGETVSLALSKVKKKKRIKMLHLGVYVLEIFVGDQRSSVSNYSFKIRRLYHETS